LRSVFIMYFFASWNLSPSSIWGAYVLWLKSSLLLELIAALVKVTTLSY
jgi:hypothetical protein